MKKTTLINGDTIFCINSLEAQMLHEHINGYFDDFITLEQSDTILDIGANIGILGLELSIHGNANSGNNQYQYGQ